MAKAPPYEGLTAEMPLRDAARRILRILLEEAFRYAPAVLRGEDTRAVHDMRVAIRRVRSALTTFDDALGGRRARQLQVAMRRIGRRLGRVRDADVHLVALRGALAGASEIERAGVTHAIDDLVVRRRAALAEFAIELSQFDRERYARAFTDG